MQLTSLKSKLVVGLPLAALLLAGSTQVSLAGGKGGKRAGKSALSKKVQANLEAAMGKPLTADQLSTLQDAAKEEKDAMTAATDKFQSVVVKTTGLTPDQVEDATKKGKGKKKAAAQG